MKQIPITVVVPVKNEEANLARCLSRLTRFAEVIVVDSASTDRTPEIARQHGATLINFEWNGRYPKKRNWLLMNHTLANPWVLFLDADEIIDDRFASAAERAVRLGTHAGYWLNYTNYFLERPLKHGLAQRKLAMFKVGAGLYERIDEDAWSHLDMEIHEHPVIEGSVGEIAERIDHNDDRGIAKFIDRHKDYALWEARRVRLLEKDGAAAWDKLTKRQKFKYRNLAKWWYPGFYFLYTYIVKAGFLDGRGGFAYAFYKAWYFYSIRLLIEEQSGKATAEMAPTGRVS
jgi:glycosyltransferase involved in cell wall biosynthesis